MATNETDHIKAAVKKIDQEMKALQNKRSHLLTKLNEIASATRKLPPEILSEIFRLAAYIPNIREPQLNVVDVNTILRIGSICTHWRCVAWSTPPLWTTSLVTEKGKLVPTIDPHLVSLIVGNARRNLISVEVDLDNLHPETMDILFQRNSAQVRALRINMREDVACVWNVLSSYFMTPSDWPNLNELWLSAKRGPLPGLLLQPPDPEDFYSPRYEGEIIPWRVPLHQLTTVRLRQLPIDQCLSLLLHCPNLEEYHCLYPNISSRFYKPSTLLPPSQRPKTLPNLRIIRWTGWDLNDEWDQIFPSFRFPGLKQLYWCMDEDFISGQESQISGPAVAWECFKPSLMGIEALDWEVDYTSIASYIPPGKVFASLRRLYVQALTDLDIISWLTELTLGKNDNENRFPALSTFHLNDQGANLKGSQVFDAVQKFLNSRRKGPRGVSREEFWRNHTRLELFILEAAWVPLRVNDKWVDVLQSFVEGGLTFQLLPPDKKPGDQWSLVLE